MSLQHLADYCQQCVNIKQDSQKIEEARIRNYGLKIKENKCDFLLEEIKYLGHVINKDDKKPDKGRASAVKHMPNPKDVKSLQSYSQEFIPNLPNLRAPLNELLHKEKKWIWTKECEQAFREIKEKLTSDLFLTHFDPNLDIIVASDASTQGVGACILHKWKDGKVRPIAHASRSLVPAERNYSQIEKEALAIIFTVTKFNRYIHGRRFTLQTDHKPLVTIFGSKKGLPTYTAYRLLRWWTILLNYDFQIQYLSTKKIGHADGLSRLVPRTSETFEDTVIAAFRSENEVENTLNNTIRELPVTLKEIKREAVRDNFIKKIKAKLWEKNPKIEETYSLCDNVLLYSARVEIPKTLQRRIVHDFHTGHLGINRMKNLMRSYVLFFFAWYGLRHH